MSLTTIRPEELAEQIAKQTNLTLIDVRTPVEFREVHVTGAENIPLDQLDPQALSSDSRDTDQPLYVVCRSGGRGQQACQRLRAAGIDNVVNVEGGTLACEQAGLEVVRGKKAMSLERQVRIAAGMLVCVGVLLSLTVHPYCIGLSAFVGVGLVFAGITDTCAMGMLIAKMPWNRLGTAG